MSLCAAKITTKTRSHPNKERACSRSRRKGECGATSHGGSRVMLAMAGYKERARARSRRKGACGDVSCRPCAPDSHSMQLPATGAALNLPVPSQQPDPLPRRTHTPSCPPSQRHSQDNCCRRRRPVPPCTLLSPHNHQTRALAHTKGCCWRELP